MLCLTHFNNFGVWLISAGEMMSVSETFLEQQMHPTVIIVAYRQALEDMLKIMKEEIRYLLSTTNTCTLWYELTSIMSQVLL